VMAEPERKRKRYRYEKLQSLDRNLYLVEGMGEGNRGKKHLVVAMLVLLVTVAILSITLVLLVRQSNQVSIISYNGTQRMQDHYDWGEMVDVDGKKQPVIKYLASRLSADDMKRNLQ